MKKQNNDVQAERMLIAKELENLWNNTNLGMRDSDIRGFIEWLKGKDKPMKWWQIAPTKTDTETRLRR